MLHTTRDLIVRQKRCGKVIDTFDLACRDANFCEPIPLVKIAKDWRRFDLAQVAWLLRATTGNSVPVSMAFAKLCETRVRQNLDAANEDYLLLDSLKLGTRFKEAFDSLSAIMSAKASIDEINRIAIDLISYINSRDISEDKAKASDVAMSCVFFTSQTIYTKFDSYIKDMSNEDRIIDAARNMKSSRFNVLMCGELGEGDIGRSIYKAYKKEIDTQRQDLIELLAKEI